MDCCCKHCTDRTPTCHSTCESYKQWLQDYHSTVKEKPVFARADRTAKSWSHHPLRKYNRKYGNE